MTLQAASEMGIRVPLDVSELEDSRSMESAGNLIADWERPKARYESRIYLRAESGGGYSVYCPSLPGVVSQGETRSEAIEMITDALRGVIATYLEMGESIPWLNDPVVPQADEDELWIAVHV